MCLTKECIDAYIERLEDGIKSYMEMPPNQRSASALNEMITAWKHIKGMRDMIEHDFDFTKSDASAWNAKMINEDGSHGGHWTVDQTSSLGVPDGVSPWCWNVTMNMMYSDYYGVAVMHNVNTTDFYADMARAFLDDADAGDAHKKLAAYYNCIARQ